MKRRRRRRRRTRQLDSAFEFMAHVRRLPEPDQESVLNWMKAREDGPPPEREWFVVLPTGGMRRL